MRKQKCENCIFYVPDEDPRYKGSYHRFPPFGLGNTDSDAFTLVNSYDWYGKYKLKIKK